MSTMDDRTQVVTVANNGTESTGFNIQAHEMFVGVVFPNMDPGAIGLEYTRDNGVTWGPVLDPADGDDLLVVKSGSDPGVIDISDFVRFVHANKAHWLRFTCAAQVSGEASIVVLTRG